MAPENRSTAPEKNAKNASTRGVSCSASHPKVAPIFAAFVLTHRIQYFDHGDNSLIRGWHNVHEPQGVNSDGIDIVSTYVFWIHHEEIEGQFDWSGSRNLRRFIQTCQEVGLLASVRCGPWDHGEVRNGGFPDWLLKKGWETRSNDTNYLAPHLLSVLQGAHKIWTYIFLQISAPD